jgi:hypothetical protein
MSSSSLLAASYPVEIQLRRSWTLPMELDDFTGERWFQNPNFGIRANCIDRIRRAFCHDANASKTGRV